MPSQSCSKDIVVGRVARHRLICIAFLHEQMVEMLEACQEIGYQAVMQHGIVPAVAPVDPVSVQAVDLKQYDRLYAKEAVL